MKTPNIGIEPKNLQQLVRLLNILLADEYVLYTKTRNFHWNVIGTHFHDLHKFFEAQYEELDDIIDEVAERARSLGGVAAGSLVEFSKMARIKEQPAALQEGTPMLAELLDNHESLIRSMREDIDICNKLGDVGTGDFITGILEQHEKMAWMIRSMVKD